MAMTMSGEQQLAAPRETVWAKLNDPEVLKACIPGCQSLEVIGENQFQAVATNRVGPVKATFKGKVRLTDLDPPNGYKISGEGDGGIAGFAKGGATREPDREGWRHAACPTTSRRRSAASLPSLASGSSTARRRSSPTISSPSSPPR